MSQLSVNEQISKTRKWGKQPKQKDHNERIDGFDEHDYDEILGRNIDISHAPVYVLTHILMVHSILVKHHKKTAFLLLLKRQQ